MRTAIIRIITGLSIILLLSLVLLYRDPPRHNHQDRFHVALFRISSTPAQEECIKGIETTFRDNGFIPGQNLDLHHFNPENDFPTAVKMAQTIASGKFDLVITISTPALQLMAAANKDGRTKHVFAAVIDPHNACLGLESKNSLPHPPWMTGMGSLLPVEETLELARKFNPKLKKIGTIINPQETCSISCLRKLKKAAAAAGILLEEIYAVNSAAVQDAANALMNREVEAIFIGGDNTIDLCTEIVAKTGLKHGVPTFSYVPGNVSRECLVGLGPDYTEIGRLTGMLAVEILRGAKPHDIPIENVMPKLLAVNLNVLPRLCPVWRVPPGIQEKADILIDNKGITHVRTGRRPTPDQLLSKFHLTHHSPKKLFFINYADSSTSEENLNGFLSEMERLGLRLGYDFELKITNAGGSINAMTKLLHQANDGSADIILITTTQALQAAINIIKIKPVVFSLVGDPIACGAGKSFTTHLPNFTGVSSMSDFYRMVQILKKYYPEVKKIGTLYCAEELNSEIYRNRFDEAAAREHLTLISIPVGTRNEIKTATQKLIAQGVDMICQISDNFHNTNFDQISHVCARMKMPLVSFVMTNAISHGAAIAIAQDYEDGGREQAWLTAEIIKGKKTADLPFRTIKRSRIIVNLRNARQCGMTIPPALLQIADLIID